MVPTAIHVNTRADKCSPIVIEGGRRVVRYHGQEFVMLGLYFARGADGQRELFYILRASDEEHSPVRS